MKRSRIAALNEWGKNKEEGVRGTAAQAATGAEGLYRLLKAIKEAG